MHGDTGRLQHFDILRLLQGFDYPLIEGKYGGPRLALRVIAAVDVGGKNHGRVEREYLVDIIESIV
jgi:hypothetical protein